MEKIRELGRYLKESWNEVKPKGGKVTWPGIEEVKSSTIVVVVTVVIVGIYLGVVDLASSWLMDLILGTNQVTR